MLPPGGRTVDPTPRDAPAPVSRRPAAEDAALAALHAQVAALVHELEVLRNDHQQLHTYHHHLRFRLAERANLWLKGIPLVHRVVRQSLVAAQALCQRLKRIGRQS
jgi:hypothetical protein